MVFCQYCNSEAELVDGLKVYPHRPDLKKLRFWNCDPCKAYVGCHRVNYPKGIYENNIALGSLANAELRKIRSETHAVLDPYWREDKYKRTEVYDQLAIKLGIKLRNCHVAMFNKEKCIQAIGICKEGLFK